jgi:hypothetical protein
VRWKTRTSKPPGVEVVVETGEVVVVVGEDSAPVAGSESVGLGDEPDEQAARRMNSDQIVSDALIPGGGSPAGIGLPRLTRDERHIDAPPGQPE